LLDFRNFVKSALTNIKYELKVLSYSIDSIKTQISAQKFEMITSSAEIEFTNDLPWLIKNFEEMDYIEKQLQSKTIKNSEVLILYLYWIFIFYNTLYFPHTL